MKFRKYFVEKEGVKSRVFYRLDNRIDRKKCVTLYAKDYDRSLGKLFSEYKNETDSRSDYFETGNVTLFEDHPLYKEARELVESLQK